MLCYRALARVADKDRRLSRPPLFFFTRLLTHEGGARVVQVRKQAHSIYFSSSLLPAFLRYAPIVVHHASLLGVNQASYAFFGFAPPLPMIRDGP